MSHLGQILSSWGQICPGAVANQDFVMYLRQFPDSNPFRSHKRTIPIAHMASWKLQGQNSPIWDKIVLSGTNFVLLGQICPGAGTNQDFVPRQKVK